MSDVPIAQLGQRIKELETELASLRRTVAGLAPERSNSSVDQPLTRRHLFARAGALATGVGAVGALQVLNGSPAAATAGVMYYGTANDAGTDNTHLRCAGSSNVLNLRNDGGGTGLFAYNHDAVAPGVQGIATNTSTGNEPAVYGRAENVGSQGVKGEITHEQNPQGAVWGVTAGLGSGVYGLNTNPDSFAGVSGYGSGFTPGVRGSNGLSANGVGVLGSSSRGRGGVFSGRAAQVRLEPSGATSHPVNGKRGDLFVDRSGRLWYCKGSSNWIQLA
jgi:hypothetical protein